MDEKQTYFDCDAVIGRPKAPLPHAAASLEEMLEQMGRLGIGRALVRHCACRDAGPETGNDLLMQQIGGRPGLIPVWMLTPDTLYEMHPAEALVDHMIGQGVRAAWMAPSGKAFVLDPWCCGHVLVALAERSVPLMVEFQDVTGRQLHEVLTAFPELPVVLLRPPREGRNRILYPLLERHSNLSMALTPTYSVYRGIEDICETFGAGRFLFGSSFPAVEGGAAVCMLSYAEISESNKQAIARGNLERLMAEVQT